MVASSDSRRYLKYVASSSVALFSLMASVTAARTASMAH